jgi:hypothetical protein
MSLLKFILASSLAFGVATLPAHAAAKKTAKAKTAQATPKPADPEADEPDTKDDSVTELDCELGNKITIYRNAGDDQHIALRWKKHLNRLTRVETSTGAERFENKFYGLIWIGIPAKGMLLDSKQNHQLANECKDAEQMKPAVSTAPDAPLINQG